MAHGYLSCLGHSGNPPQETGRGPREVHQHQVLFRLCSINLHSEATVVFVSSWGCRALGEAGDSQGSLTSPWWERGIRGACQPLGGVL